MDNQKNGRFWPFLAKMQEMDFSIGGSVEKKAVSPTLRVVFFRSWQYSIYYRQMAVRKIDFLTLD